MKTLQVMERIEKTAENNVSDVRRIERHEIGKVVRQGDVYLHLVAANHPHGSERRSRQLAVGDTKGSRHILTGGSPVSEGTAFPKWVDKNMPLGPFFSLSSRATVTHPEHADVSLPKGCYQVTHQMDARTRERVID